MFAIGQENPLGCALLLLAGGALALALGALRCRRAGVPPRRIALATALLALLTPVGSHLLYCLVDLESALYGHSVGYLLAFWQPGGMLYGGMAGAALALCLARGRQRARLFEGYAPSAAWMAAVYRVGEGLMGQGYGEYAMEETALCRFPFMMYDVYYEAWAWALFVAEALVALLLFAALLKRRPAFEGDGALWFAGLYASAQIVLESLRRDEFLRWGFVRVEELASAVVLLLVLLCYALRTRGQRRRAKALCFALFACLVTLVVLLEFATEGRVPFLLFLDVGGCYGAMACACALLAGCVLWMRRLSLDAKGENAR